MGKRLFWEGERSSRFEKGRGIRQIACNHLLFYAWRVATAMVTGVTPHHWMFFRVMPIRDCVSLRFRLLGFYAFFFIDHRTCRAIWILIWIFFRVFDFTVYIITQPGIRFETFVDYLALFQIICWLKVILMLWGYIFNLSELGACIVYCTGKISIV